jgi:PIF1-like helicase
MRKERPDAKISLRKHFQGGKLAGYEIQINNECGRDLFMSKSLKIIDDNLESKGVLQLCIPESRCIIYCLDIDNPEIAARFIKALQESDDTKENDEIVENIKQSPQKFGCSQHESFSQDADKGLLLSSSSASSEKGTLLVFRRAPRPLPKRQGGQAAPAANPKTKVPEAVDLVAKGSGKTPEKSIRCAWPKESPSPPIRESRCNRSPNSKSDLTPRDKKRRPIGTTPIKSNLLSSITIQSSPSSSQGHKKTFTLTEDQLTVMKACIEGHSVFFSGGAGTGKSSLLAHIIKELNSKHGAGKVAITATTGLASCSIGGCTVHQFAGIPLSVFEGSDEEISKEVLRRPLVVRRWKEIKVLIIDEISMLSPKVFEAINTVAKTARSSGDPMGGVQVILTGDFLQLPPVVKRTTVPNTSGATMDLSTQFTEGYASVKCRHCGETGHRDRECVGRSSAKTDTLFCFQSKAWKQIIRKSFLLHEVFRQRDSDFIALLDAVRFGVTTEKTLRGFNACVNRQLDVTDGILPTHIHTHRNDVDKLNKQELDRLTGQEYVFDSVDSVNLV